MLPPGQVTDLLMSRADVLQFLHWDLAFFPVFPHDVSQATASRLTVGESRPSAPLRTLQVRLRGPRHSASLHKFLAVALRRHDPGFHLQSLFRTFDNLQTFTLDAPLQVPSTVEQAPDLAALGQKLKRLVIFDSPRVPFVSNLVLLGHAAVKAITVYNATVTVQTMKRRFASHFTSFS
ncbi:hypothetical protein EXIGLDRAFT_449222 [Exidia glandulosa HHB12029]|uniref:Uncharacterized protein n=1 Tax=Exidia glandulosa HHB12029 TaxID=1314781 RepID=A0A165K7U6_EXIGL|nr:hypothetical protein EXIGLDRAFT_449222 [Exidia glandulosa HHB12029]